MPQSKLLFHDAARQKVLAGAAALADAVRVTLGPQSRRVLLGRRWGAPLACDDGVTIAKEIELADAEENLGAQMLRQAPSAPARRSATAPPPPPCSPTGCSPRAFATSSPGRARSRSSAASTGA